MTQTTTNPDNVDMPAVQVKSSWSFLRGHMREYGILFALIAIMAFFQVATGGILLKPVNLTNLILQNSYIIIMAIGMLLIIVAGHIDLSVGSVMGFIGALAAVITAAVGVVHGLREHVHRDAHGREHAAGEQPVTLPGQEAPEEDLDQVPAERDERDRKQQLEVCLRVEREVHLGGDPCYSLRRSTSAGLVELNRW